MKLIILAAGKGTRFLPITNTIPKGMIPILGKPLLEHALGPYVAHVDEIVFVINHPLGEQIKAYFGENYRGHTVSYVVQKEQKGTLDALLTCKDLMQSGELFCVCNGDDLVLEGDVENAIGQNKISIGVSKKVMPKNYLGIEVKDGYATGFNRHDDSIESKVEDLFYNGFSILDSKIFNFEPVMTRDGEMGLPQTLFAHLETYPLKVFPFHAWETVNGPADVSNAEEFLKNL